MTRQSAVHDRIRADLLAVGLLKPDFAARPDRLGGVREMGIGCEEGLTFSLRLAPPEMMVLSIQ